jgi:hypothetical protein
MSTTKPSPLIDFSPPAQSWADYLDSLPPGRAPRPQDIFERWDSHKFICPARPRNGTPAQFAAHVEYALGPGKCPCGGLLKPGGLRGEGERRAYLGWLAGMMGDEEANHFYATVVSNHQDVLMQLAIVPVTRRMLAWLREIDNAG